VINNHSLSQRPESKKHKDNLDNRKNVKASSAKYYYGDANIKYFLETSDKYNKFIEKKKIHKNLIRGLLGYTFRLLNSRFMF